jgi:maltose O-acetyltransferase
LVAIADGTYLRSGNHKFDQIDIPIQLQGHFSSEIDFNNRKYSVVIEDNVWIGARAIILSGAHIGEGSVIAAGAVVSRKIPPYSIVVGNPGRVVGNRKSK